MQLHRDPLRVLDNYCTQMGYCSTDSAGRIEPGRRDVRLRAQQRARIHTAGVL